MIFEVYWVKSKTLELNPLSHKGLMEKSHPNMPTVILKDTIYYLI